MRASRVRTCGAVGWYASSSTRRATGRRASPIQGRPACEDVLRAASRGKPGASRPCRRARPWPGHVTDPCWLEGESKQFGSKNRPRKAKSDPRKNACEALKHAEGARREGEVAAKPVDESMLSSMDSAMLPEKIPFRAPFDEMNHAQTCAYPLHKWVLGGHDTWTRGTGTLRGPKTQPRT